MELSRRNSELDSEAAELAGKVGDLDPENQELRQQLAAKPPAPDRSDREVLLEGLLAQASKSLSQALERYGNLPSAERRSALPLKHDLEWTLGSLTSQADRPPAEIFLEWEERVSGARNSILQERNELKKRVGQLEKQIEQQRTGGTPAATTESAPAAATESEQQRTGSTPAATTESEQQRTGSTPAATTESAPAATTESEQQRTGSTPAATTESAPAAATESEQQRTGSTPAATESAPPPDLEAITRRVLAGLKLGRQAPGYKVAAKALAEFVKEFGACKMELEALPGEASSQRPEHTSDAVRR